MERIVFEDYEDEQTTPLNAENLNTLQDNIEGAIDNAISDIETKDTEQDGRLDSLEDNYYFKPNEILEYGIIVLNGVVTYSASKIYANIVFPKSLEKISNIEVLTCNMQARGESGYLDNAGAAFQYYCDFTANEYTVTVTNWRNDYKNAEFTITKSSAFTNVSNNTLVSLRGNIKFKFT